MSPLVVDALVFAGGLFGLTMGADWVVRGGSRLAEEFGIPELVIGLTVVAFGTSAPELVVSAGASLRGQPGLAVGNVMGSTVANVGLIVGVAALVRPIDVHRRVLVKESPLLIFVLALVMLLSLNDALGRLDGLVLLVGFTVYIVFLLRWAGEGQAALPELGEEPTDEEHQPVRDWAMTIGGLAALLGGAHFVLDGAIGMARAFGVPEAVIGATMVAVGTSLPELASTAAAAFRGLGDMAIGNIIGSNVFNLGLVLGTAAVVRPLLLPPMQVAGQVIPALIFCVTLVPLAYTGMRVNRFEGAFLLAGYGGFIWWVL